MAKDPLTVTKHLLELQQGEELLLLNAVWPRPLYVPSGASYVLDFIGGLHGRESLNAQSFDGASPGDRHLFRTLMAHQIVVWPQRDEPLSVSPEALRTPEREALTVCFCLSAGRERMSEETLGRALQWISRRLAKEGALRVIFNASAERAMQHGEWEIAPKLVRAACEQLDRLRPDAQLACEMRGNLCSMPEDLPPGTNITLWVEWPEDELPPEMLTSANTAPRMVLVLVHGRNVERMVNIAEKVAEVKGVAGIGFEPIWPEEASDERPLPDPSVFADQLAAIYRARLFKPEHLYPINRWLAKLERGRGYPWECGMPLGNTLCVQPSGDVYPCLETCAPPFRLGRLGEFGVQDPGFRYDAGRVKKEPNSSAAPATKGWATQVERWGSDWTVDAWPECATCPWRYLCGGGCPGRRMRAHRRAKGERGVSELPNSETLYAGRYSPAELTHRLICEPRRRGFEMLLWSLARQKREDVKRDA